jgi:IS5 family transposase
MSRPRDDRQKDLLLPALDQIIDMVHPLVRLGAVGGADRLEHPG